MTRTGLRKVVMAAVVAAGPVVGLAVELLPSAPAPQAQNFVCASIDQINVGLCIGPPVAASMHPLG